MTLTFNSLPEPKRAAHEVKLLMRRCSHARGRFPNLWTLERGSLRGRIHCHLLLPARSGLSLTKCGAMEKSTFKPCCGGFGALREAAAYVSRPLIVLCSIDSGTALRRVQPEAIPIAAASAELLVQRLMPGWGRKARSVTGRAWLSRRSGS